ncbi:DUF748 domain-containing protein [Pontibacter sp. SGAir0037]|uniref:DUF748 domain-containing protein n=1 Tax=Pontibacter sp. SGAir0037 TaxID=2571030 RepID=UPI0010CD6409|nr:DUF748 domain-containing protein [Pontibacter sp. SGAir0037]QCR24248.1 hypothetical protein C1N53_19060 [Pontibacter sp. SGAir0037]
MTRRSKRIYITLGIILLLLIIFRLALPSIVKRYVNKTLSELPGYNGHIEDIDLSLYRGAYKIKGLVLEEEKGNPKYPFLKIAETDLSVEWKSLFKGKVAGEVLMGTPEINIVATSSTDTSQATQEHWTEVVKDLMPITINRFEATNGMIAYRDFNASPDINMHIENMHLVALNLANVEEEGNALPSTVSLTGTSVGGGSLRGDMKVNMLKEVPDFDMKMRLTKVNLTSLNDFVKAYGKFDIEQGQMELYSELKAKDGKLDGYVKPFFENVKVLNWEKDREEGGFFRAAWEAVVGLVKDVVENPKEDNIATQIPIEGDLNQPDTNTWKTVLNVLRHAYIKAFTRGLESTASGAANGEEESR